MKEFVVINEKDNVGIRLTARIKFPRGISLLCGILPRANTL